MQLCYLRFPGAVLGTDQLPAPSVLAFLATQLKLAVPDWTVYVQREQTRREHLQELQVAFGFQPFGLPHYRAAVPWLAAVARQTDKDVVLVQALLGHLRRQSTLLPSVAALERLSAEALTRANRWLYQTLTEDLPPATWQALDNLLTRREGSALTWLPWSECTTKPAAGQRTARARRSASMTKFSGMDSRASQPTTLREQRFSQVAK